MFSIKSNKVRKFSFSSKFFSQNRIHSLKSEFRKLVTLTFVDIIYEKKIRCERESRGYAMAKSIREIWEQTRIYTPHAMYALARPNADNIKFLLDSFSDRSKLSRILETYVNRKEILLQKIQMKNEKEPI